MGKNSIIIEGKKYAIVEWSGEKHICTECILSTDDGRCSANIDDVCDNKIGTSKILRKSLKLTLKDL